MTLLTNIYGGPGTGKSTTAALVFGKLKVAGVNAELVTEFAKDLTWEERSAAIACQPYIFGKQYFRLQRLQGKVDVIVTDSPILLSTVYGEKESWFFAEYVNEVHKRWKTLDVLLRRDHLIHPYNPKGRNQSEEEAEALDAEIKWMLNIRNVPFVEIPVQEADKTAQEIVNIIDGMRETA